MLHFSFVFCRQSAMTTTTTTATVATDIITAPNFMKFAVLLLVSFSLLFLTHHLCFSTTPTVTTITFSTPLQSQPNVSTSPPFPRLPVPDVFRTGIVDETSAMSWEFEVGEFMGSVEELNDLIGENGNEDDVKEENAKENTVGVGKYVGCEDRMRNYVLCFDIEEKHERHCPDGICFLRSTGY